jgi:hypothetical protein
MASALGRRGIASALRRAAFRSEAAAEAYQCGFHIVKQMGPGRRRGLLTGDKNVVDAGLSQKGKKEARGLPQAAAGAVADDCPADLACGRKSSACGRARLGPPAGLHNQEAAAFRDAIRDKKELAARPEALDGEWDWIAGWSGRIAQAVRRLRPLERRR